MLVAKKIKYTSGGFETLHRRGTGAAHSAPEGLGPPKRDTTLSLRAHQLPVTSYQFVGGDNEGEMLIWLIITVTVKSNDINPT